MNIERLQSIYQNTSIADKTDIEDVRQLTEDYPYFALPYVILSKYYFETRHYRFEDILRQAAMRVKDRKALYEYIHSIQQDIPAHVIEESFSPEEIVHEQAAESAISVADFLETEITEQASEPLISDQFTEETVEATSELISETPVITEENEPEEFVIDTHSETRSIDKIEIDYDIIGEEIETEFSFSKSFAPSEEEQDNNEIIVVDNTGFSATVEPVKETTEVDEHLRKYPVYSIDNYFKDQAPAVPVTEEEPSSEKDFFAWLKSPKTQETVQGVKEEVAEASKELEKQPEALLQTDENVTKKSDSLDLIDRFISINPQISRPKKEFFNPENMAKRSEVIDLEFVSETLANIYYEQGNYELAIKAYEKLSLQNPAKESYFADLIEKIKNERK
ncbi:MAG: tetratricopeptide repeat protein [Chitinophagaceae bacterium]